MQKYIGMIFVLVLLLGCGGGSSTSTVPNSADSTETKFLKTLIVGKTLHEYDGYIYTKYEFKSNGDAQFYTYFDGEVYTEEYPWSLSGNPLYTISNGVFTLEYPTSKDICTLESNTTTQVNMKCKDTKNFILWTSEEEAKANPFSRE